MQPSPAMGPWRGGTGGIAGETFPNGVCPSAWVRAKLKGIENGIPVHYRYRYSHSPECDTTRHKVTFPDLVIFWFGKISPYNNFRVPLYPTSADQEQ